MTTILNSGLYLGQVMHRRLKPRIHKLQYRVFYLLLDLDEIDLHGRRLRLFSHNRFNFVSFYDRDHGDGSGMTLRTYAEKQLKAAAIAFDGGAIRLLTMPRILGYAFNPLSIYFCFNRSGAPAAIIYEVNNTFRQRHSYVIAADIANDGVIRQQTVKSLYVSPFFETDMTYDFAIASPKENIALSIIASAKGEPQMMATLSARRQDLSDVQLLRALCLYPLLTMKVIAAIHWEALRIWLKGVSLRRRPAAPLRSFTIGRQLADDAKRIETAHGEEVADHS